MLTARKAGLTGNKIEVGTFIWINEEGEGTLVSSNTGYTAAGTEYEIDFPHYMNSENINNYYID